MNTEFDFETSRNPIVYVRTVPVASLPEDIRAEAGEAAEIYAVHAENGDRLAFVKDRDLAFSLARQNDFAPVSVH